MKKAHFWLVAASALIIQPARAEWFDSEHSLLDKGKQLFQTGQWDEALQPFSEAIAKNPSSAEAYYLRALAYHSLRQFDKSLVDLDKAIEIEPNQPDYYVSRGLVFSNKKEFQKAIADFDKALALSPDLQAAKTNRQFVLDTIEQEKTLAQEKIDSEKAETARLAQEKEAAAQAEAAAALAPAKRTHSAHITASAGSTPSAKEQERQAIEKQAAETKLRERLLAEERAREKDLTQTIEREKAEKEKMARELAEARRLAEETAHKKKSHVASAEGMTAREPVSDPASAAAAAEVNKPIEDKWALIVGISKFNDSHLNLRYPSKDAQDFYSYLTTQANFAKDHVKLLTDSQATRGRILSELGDKWLPRVANPNDLVVIYISSHGSSSDLDVGGVNYLLAYDSDVDNLYASGIPMQDLTRIIKGRVHSDRVVVILDACHSGAATPESKGLVRKANVDAEEIMQGTGQLVISSSQPNQVSWEAVQEPNSVFTKYLMEGLRSKGAMTSLGDAFQYMRDKVQAQVLRERGVLQTPVLKSKWEGRELLLGAPATSPREGL